MAELPKDVVEEAERLTRLARTVRDENEVATYQRERERLVEPHGFTARLRDEDETLVLHPAEWLEDGVVQIEEIQDVDRAIEIPLAGPGDPEAWEEVEAHNAALVDEVEDAHGDVHAANARAFADFMGNHYARRIDTTTAHEVEEFLSEYFPRNAWPTDEQRDRVEETLHLLLETAGVNVSSPTIERR
ncbi:MAG: DUF7108 family protein [Halobacteriota archaeon]